MNDSARQQRWRSLSAALDRLLDIDIAERQAWIANTATLTAQDRATLQAMLRSDGSFAPDVLLEGRTAEHLQSDANVNIEPPHELQQTLGDYRLIRKLAEGGMSSVWLAEKRENASNKQDAVEQFAIKQPHRGLMSGDIDRFLHEGHILATLAHPNIARLVDTGIDDGAPYLVLAYVRGQPITEYAAAHSLVLSARLKLFLQVLSAVQYAHGRLVLHRDLKPANIFVTDAGEVRLLDFGVAKLISSVDAAQGSGDMTLVYGRAMTPLYASPEQLRGEPLAITSDVYSLGLVLYELLTDKRARNDDSGGATAILAQVLASKPPRPSEALDAARDANRVIARRELVGDIDLIVGKALAVAPQERYPTANALAEDIARYLAREPIQARAPTVWYRTKKLVARHRLASAAATLALVGIAATAAVALWQRGVAIEQRDAAKAEVDRRVKSHGFMIRLISEYAPKDKPLTSVELLDLGVNSVENYFKDDYREMVATLLRLNARYIELGEAEREKNTTFKALEYAQKSGELNLIAGTNCMVAKVMAISDIEAAQRHLKAAKEAFVRAAEPSVGIRAECWFNEISVLNDSGEYVKAIAVAEEGMNFFRSRSEATRGLFYTSMLNAAGRSYTFAQRYTDAERVFKELLEIDSKMGAAGTSSNWVSQANLLNVWLQAGNYAAASDHVARVILPAAGNDHAKLPPMLLSRWASIAAARDQRALAAELLQRIKEQPLASLPLRHAQASAVMQLCQVDGNSVCQGRELQHFAELTRARFAFNPREHAINDLISAQLALLSGRVDQALIDIERGLALSQRGGDDSLAVTASLFELRARARLARNEHAVAQVDAEAAVALLNRHMLYPHERSVRYAEALLTRAESFSAGGNTDIGRRDLLAADRILRNQLSPSHPNLERIERLSQSMRNSIRSISGSDAKS
jgi:eukaryotic-like serine/threonine-protein kinase